MTDHDDRFDCLERRLDEMQQQMSQIMEMVAVGKGAFVAAKVLGWVTATAVAIVELWRTFGSHK
jgi:hypothetical protein